MEVGTSSFTRDWQLGLEHSTNPRYMGYGNARNGNPDMNSKEKNSMLMKPHISTKIPAKPAHCEAALFGAYIRVHLF